VPLVLDELAVELWLLAVLVDVVDVTVKALEMVVRVLTDEAVDMLVDVEEVADCLVDTVDVVVDVDVEEVREKASPEDVLVELWLLPELVEVEDVSVKPLETVVLVEVVEVADPLEEAVVVVVSVDVVELRVKSVPGGEVVEDWLLRVLVDVVEVTVKALEAVEPVVTDEDVDVLVELVEVAECLVDPVVTVVDVVVLDDRVECVPEDAVLTLVDVCVDVVAELILEEEEVLLDEIGEEPDGDVLSVLRLVTVELVLVTVVVDCEERVLVVEGNDEDELVDVCVAVVVVDALEVLVEVVWLEVALVGVLDVVTLVLVLVLLLPFVVVEVEEADVPTVVVVLDTVLAKLEVEILCWRVVELELLDVGRTRSVLSDVEVVDVRVLAVDGVLLLDCVLEEVEVVDVAE